MDKRIRKAANDRTILIDGIINIIESKLGSAQNNLLKQLVNDLVDKLDREGDQIKNTLRNKRLITLVDNVFTNYAKGKGLEVGAAVIKGVSQIMDFNSEYFSVFTEPAKLGPIHDTVKSNLNDWLGISATGKVQPNGYLDTLINDQTIKNAVKDLTVKSVFNQAGYQETKKNLGDFITGNGESGSLGAMQKYYRNFVYDTFSQVDRTNAKLYADKLSFNYAIYEGGLIETSRIFCKEHNGKVFSREEIADFDPPEAKPPGYNPFFDLGGYGCRHHLNWIPDAVAFALRPELRTATPPPVKPKEDPKPAKPEKPKPAPVKDPQKPKPTPPPPVKTAPVKVEPKPAAGDGPAPIFKPVKSVDQGRSLAIKILTEKTPLNVGNVEIAAQMTVKRLNEYLQQFDKLTSEYEIFKGYEKTPVKVLFKSESDAFGYVSGFNNGKRIGEINFGHKTDNISNRTYVKNGFLRTKSRVDRDKGDIATITHEFAHVITREIQQHLEGDRRVVDFWPDIHAIRTQYINEMKSYKSRVDKINEIYLGHYASTNANEFLAEAFTEYKLSSKPSKYAKLVGSLVDKYFKYKK